MSQELIRAVIIDDEQDAIDLLKELLKEHREVEVVATAIDSEQGYRAILEHHPDLVFLDIQMPRENGLQLAGRLPDLPDRPAIIFVTAYDQFAISAIKKAALDYILKPVGRRDLEEALSRYQHYRYRTFVSSKLEELIDRISHPQRIKFNTRSGFVVIDPDDILFCIAEGNYTEVILTSGKSEMVTHSLGSMEAILPSAIFFRSSRSHLINIRYILRLERKNRTCELGANGFTHTLIIPRLRMATLEKIMGQ